MSSNSNALVPRQGPAPRVSAGPKVGQRSLYRQQVLDEDTYTDALSTIITRDFFPNLPHIHATNAYLTALTNNDPELLSSSIRRLAALAAEKEDKGKGRDDGVAERRQEFENAGTPYINKPGQRSAKTPIGARGWDTPAFATNRRREEEELDADGDEGDFEDQPGPSRPRKKVKKAAPIIRDDLSLDAFQRNYTSEDNASFVQIVDEDNRRRKEERWGWAWEAQERAETRRIAGEERRKAILNAATSGNWRVDAEGRRLIGGLSEGGSDKAAGQAWKDERRMIAPPSDSSDSSRALVAQASSGALVQAGESSRSDTGTIREEAVPDGHPLARALAEAGLPSTALVSKEDGAIVPHRESATGSGADRGRGDEDRNERQLAERGVMGDEHKEKLAYAGSGADMWAFKTRNNFYFPADANSDPYPKARNIAAPDDKQRQAPAAISHANTRLPEDDDVGPAPTRGGGSSRRGSSPARSWVDAAVNGTPYRPRAEMPSVDNYPLLPNDPSPSPQDLPSLLTWGTLLATPKALDGSDDPLDSRPSFKLPEPKRRDELGRKLGDKASRSLNDTARSYTTSKSLSDKLRTAAERTHRSAKSAATPSRMGAPSATPRRQDNLTPAGKRLLERSLGLSPMTSSGKISTSGRNRGAAMEQGSGWGSSSSKRTSNLSWTPSPARHS